MVGGLALGQVLTSKSSAAARSGDQTAAAGAPAEAQPLPPNEPAAAAVAPAPTALGGSIAAPADVAPATIVPAVISITGSCPPAPVTVHASHATHRAAAAAPPVTRAPLPAKAAARSLDDLIRKAAGGT